MIIKITNTPRDYAWGSHSLITDYLGIEPTGKPMAEIWFGTHLGSPAVLAESPNHTLLEQLGGHQLPFLLKLLAAETPLSIQAHPNAEQAKDGFARETAAGIPISAAERNYKDDRPKPEMLVALSNPFEALCGFAEIDVVKQTLRELRRAAEPALAEAIDDWNAVLSDSATDASAKTRTIFDAVMELDAASVALLCEQANRAAGILSGGDSAALPSLGVLQKLQQLYPADRGVLLSLFLNYVALKPGEAVSLGAGNIHAYLHGLGVEIMANSDNVLRGGLTSKHVDVAELTSVLDFVPTAPPVVSPTTVSQGLYEYPSRADDFLLYRAELSGSTVLADLNLPNHSILLCTAGEVAVSNSIEQREVLRRGEAAFVAKDARTFSLAGSGTVFIATSAR